MEKWLPNTPAQAIETQKSPQLVRWDLKKLNPEDKEWIVEKEDGYYCAFVEEHIARANKQFGCRSLVQIETNQTNINLLWKYCLSKKNMEVYEKEANSQIISALLKKFRQIYFLCKNELALRLYENLHELEVLNGAFAGLENVLLSENAKYTSHQFVNEVVESLATQIRSTILPTFKNSLIGCLIDETTDISITSQLIIYYRVLNELTGTEKVVFGRIQQLDNGKAETIFHSLLCRLEIDGIDFKKNVVSFGSDGASVMLENMWELPREWLV
eukprot:Pompholyxophrys_sp_v1_NODE_64_length_2597_cov_2.546814.p1 type:complete len:272 gc:universal NODE_64_length_2597_cov_2.546814:380-1195(+)